VPEGDAHVVVPMQLLGTPNQTLLMRVGHAFDLVTQFNNQGRRFGYV
jgi:hypothetical protein